MLTVKLEFFADSSINMGIPDVPKQFPETCTRISPGRVIPKRSKDPVAEPSLALIS